MQKVGTLNWQRTERYTRDDLLDTIQGMECDLESCVELMVKVACGKQTRDEMGRWVSLNYPYYRKALPKHLRERRGRLSTLERAIQKLSAYLYTLPPHRREEMLKYCLQYIEYFSRPPQ